MENENKTIPQPFDVVEKLREAIRLLGYDVYEFKAVNRSIDIRLEMIITRDPPVAFGKR